jgi:hypothetical protein
MNTTAYNLLISKMHLNFTVYCKRVSRLLRVCGFDLNSNTGLTFDLIYMHIQLNLINIFVSKKLSLTK